MQCAYRQAKLDAMAAAAVCARSYGPAALAPHLPALWAALRSELLPATGVGGPAAAPDEAQRLEELAGAAAGCLTVGSVLARPAPECLSAGQQARRCGQS